MDTWAASTSWLLETTLQWAWGCRSFRVSVLVPLDKYPEVGLLDLMVVLFLISWGNSILFSTEAAPVCIPTNSAQGFPSSTSSPTLTSFLADNSRSNRREATPHCGSDLPFPDDSWCWVPFYVPVAICMSSLKRCLFWFSANFSVGLFVVLLTSPLYILEFSPLTVCDLQIFSLIRWFAFSLYGWFPLVCRSLLVWWNPTCLFLLFFFYY